MSCTYLVPTGTWELGIGNRRISLSPPFSPTSTSGTCLALCSSIGILSEVLGNELPTRYRMARISIGSASQLVAAMQLKIRHHEIEWA